MGDLLTLETAIDCDRELEPDNFVFVSRGGVTCRCLREHATSYITDDFFFSLPHE